MFVTRLTYKNRPQNILLDKVYAHLLMTCLLSLCHCFRNSCTYVQKRLPPYSRFNSVTHGSLQPYCDKKFEYLFL